MTILPLSLSDVYAAYTRITPFLPPTPLEHAPGLRPNVWLKLENLNKMRAFKVRGALNAMLALDDSARQRGIVTASSGNHAQGVAYAARQLGLPAQVLMAHGTSQRKQNGVRRLGIEPVLFGESYDDAEREARRRERDEGLTFISPYNDAQVIAGQGTIGLEILDQLPAVMRVLVPVGGGGLIGGVGLALKSLWPAVQMIGVNAAVSPEMYNAVSGETLPLSHHTLADALPGEIEAGSITLDLAREYVDSMVLVSEDAIAEAMRWLLREHGLVGEGGGVVGIAALLSGVVPQDDAPTAIVVSGGNVDVDVLRQVLG